MSNNAAKLKSKQEAVEQMGVFFEKSGFAPMAGRVFAYLLLAEPPQKDFYEIQEFLKASKSAISNAIKYLTSIGLVKYLTFSGDRRRYFQVDMEGWMKNVQLRIQSTAQFNSIINDVLEHRKGSKNLEFNEKLESMNQFYVEMGEVMHQFLSKWNKKNG